MTTIVAAAAVAMAAGTGTPRVIRRLRNAAGSLAAGPALTMTTTTAADVPAAGNGDP
jgi:hypothetical protein